MDCRTPSEAAILPPPPTSWSDIDDYRKELEVRVKHCPTDFPAGFYWYGGKQRGQGKIPKWVELLLADLQDGKTNQANDTGICEEEADDDSEKGAQLEAEAGINLEEAETPQPRQGANEYPSKKPARNISAGYSLRRHPRPSRKLIDPQVVQARD